MQVQIGDSITQTIFFSALFLGTVIFSMRKNLPKDSFSKDLTNELKGLAILAVVFSHIGYFLSTDTRFLFPLSILAGVGVNLFLFLSGFGLTKSALEKTLSPLQFYTKRLKRLFLPLWIVIILFLFLDKVFLNLTYSFNEIIFSFLGYFPVSDLWHSLNSPFWYFTLIFFYYLLFPWSFWKKIPYFAPIILLMVGLVLVELPIPVRPDVLNLYKLHLLAFPSGVLVALIDDKLINQVKGIFTRYPRFWQIVIKIFLTALFIYIFSFTAYHSNVGKGRWMEQLTSLVTMVSLIIIFFLNPWKIKLFNLVGIYSYEIYLLHWPILSRHDFLYKCSPPFLATALYLMVFLILGFILNKLVNSILDRVTT